MSEGNRGVQRRAKENIGMLQGKLAELREAAQASGSAVVPRVTGYLAVSQQLAEAMKEKGVSAAIHERDEAARNMYPGLNSDLYVWDALAAEHALSQAEGKFAGDSSQDVRIVKLAMADPQPEKSGLLQWQVTPDNAEVAAEYTIDQFRGELEAIQNFAAQMALQSEVEYHR
jgi:hypothetical protein